MQLKDRQSAKDCPNPLMSRNVHTNSYNGLCQSVSATDKLRISAHRKFRWRWRIKSPRKFSVLQRIPLARFQTISSDKRLIQILYSSSSTFWSTTNISLSLLLHHLLLRNFVYWQNFRGSPHISTGCPDFMSQKWSFKFVEKHFLQFCRPSTSVMALHYWSAMYPFYENYFP